jgi:hypothetical protein
MAAVVKYFTSEELAARMDGMHNKMGDQISNVQAVLASGLRMRKSEKYG